MKRKWWAAGALAVVCVALALAGQNSRGGADFLYALTLPFSWAGAGLRALSLSGWAGNALALLIYVLASLTPLLPLVRKNRRPKGILLRLLLAAMSAYLFFLLYFMVNPSMIQALFHPGLGGAQDMQPVESALLCVYFYSLLIAYWIIKVIQDTDRIPLQLRRLMHVLGAVMIVSVFYINVAGLRGALASLPPPSGDAFAFGLNVSMSGGGASYPIGDGLIAVIRFLTDSAPTILLLGVLPMADRLLKGLEQSYFSEENQRYAAAIALRCRLVILVSLGGMLLIGALQLILARSLYNIHLSGDAPILVLAVSLAMMLLSRYLQRSYAVYKENQMMI